MPRHEVIEALANYFQIDIPMGGDLSGSYDWCAGCTISGNDGEYRWLTLENVVDALDRAWLLSDDDDWDD